jgi:uncharacterized membrane protein YgdD (TMEM256/DUF423 family)
MSARFPLLAAGLCGATGVALCAFGAHALSGFLAGRGMAPVWETAVRYQLLHSVALLALGVGSGPLGAAAPRAARLWTAGVVVFSGSLYALCLGAPRWLGAVTPVGGLCLIAGWVVIAAAGLRAKRDEA